MTGLLADQLPELVSFRVFDLIAEQIGRHPVRFVANHEVQIGCCPQLGLQRLRTRRHVEAHDEAPALGERIACNRALNLLAADHLEIEGELLLLFVLPLLDEISGRHDQASLQVAADDQLLDEETGHDGLARAGVVREHKPKRSLRKHVAVDCGNLMRIGVDPRRVHGEVRVEQVGKANSLRFRGDLEGVDRTRKADQKGSPISRLSDGSNARRAHKTRLPTR